ncbi:MAG: molybdopterin synthase sulfur carrier subunit [Epsilonproteobacteria bacterium]|nr:MAG: molybdopterin synthase sulfur carrier subunit [Campylobacterota bacterium]
MIQVEFLGPINKPKMSLNISNLNELKDILKQDKSMQIWLENSSIAINDKITKNPNSALKDGDVVCLLPPVCGG